VLLETSSPAAVAEVAADLAMPRHLPVGIARAVPVRLTGGFAMKNACAIVLQVKEYFYRLEQISTPLGIE
jgi:hypothetical protein